MFYFSLECCDLVGGVRQTCLRSQHYYVAPTGSIKMWLSDWTINGMILKIQDLNMFSCKPRDSQPSELSLSCVSFREAPRLGWGLKNPDSVISPTCWEKNSLCCFVKEIFCYLNMEGGGAIPVSVWRLKRRNQLGLVLIHTLVRISEGQYLLGKK